MHRQALSSLALLATVGLAVIGCDEEAEPTQVVDLGRGSLRDAGTLEVDASVLIPGGQGGAGGGGQAGAGGGEGGAGGGGEGGAGGGILVPGACTDGDTRPCPDDCGVQRCEGGSWGELCEPGGDELCNDRDDDCDGEVDETFQAKGTGCTVSEGNCSSRGVQVCSAAGDALECDAPPVEVQAEICDGADNDCDNQVDEDFPGRTCCTEDFQCAPGQSCDGGECTGGGGPNPNPNPGGGGQPAAGCANPTPMPGFGQYNGNNGENAGVDSGSCGGFLGGESVFSFTLGETRRVRLDTNGALVDTVIYVRTTCADGFSEVACDDDGGQGSAAQVEFEAQANVEYFVVVDSFLFGGGFTLNFGPADGPAPECAGDLDCPLGEFCVAGECVADGCLDDFDCPLGEFCDDGMCTPNAGGCVLDADCAAGQICQAGQCVAAPDPGCVVDADCPAGQACQAGACVVPPAEPVCDAPVVMVAPGRYEANTAGRPDQHTPSCQARASGGEAAFLFVLDEAQRVSLSTEGSGFDTVLSVRTLCDDAASEVVCDDDGGAGVQSATAFDAQAGVPYVVLVDGYNGASGAVVLDFAFEGGAPDPDPDPDPVGCDACGAGDRCVVNQCFEVEPACPVSLNAERISGEYGGDSSTGADNNAPSCSRPGSPEHTLAYAVDAPRRVTASTAGSDYDTVLYVMSPCGEELVCNDDSGLGLSSSVSFDAVPGVLYYIVVDGYNGAAGRYVLTVE